MPEVFKIMKSWRREEQKAVTAAGIEMTASIPWAMIAPHERQADRNHYQTLVRLNERGGLSASEAVAVLENRAWHKMDDAAAYRRLQELVQQWKEMADVKESTDQAAPTLDQG